MKLCNFVLLFYALENIMFDNFWNKIFMLIVDFSFIY